MDIPTFEKSVSGMQVDEKRSLMTPHLEYLETRKLPQEKVEAPKIIAKVVNDQAVRGTLYQR